jgi:aspartyl-tRNA(Asn)/glutamyl-tRNA(Gln) amidotransferase subunit B
MPLGSKVFGTRCEVKNVNSIRFVAKAIEYEAKRQVREIEEGREVQCETRLFDANTGATKSMRSKESSSDYRYIPEPDLKPVKITDEMIENARKNLPELPFIKKKRYITELGLAKHEAGLLTEEIKTSKYFENLLSQVGDAKLCANWLAGELFAKLNESGRELETLNTQDFAELLIAIKKGEISGKQGKEVFAEMFATNKKAAEVIKEKGFVQVSDEKAILQIIQEVLERNTDKVVEYKFGKVKLFGFFTGEVMKASKGMFNPALTSKLLKDKLDN